MSLVAIVGLTGSGKSEVTKYFAEQGYKTIRFGDITDDILNEQGLPLTEENEKEAREGLRKKHGMASYAVANLSKIQVAIEVGDVVLDGLYSWSELKYLREELTQKLIVIAVHASPETRYHRLETRLIRPLTREEALARDYAEIENIEKAGPIAYADFMIINEEPGIDMLRAKVEKVYNQIHQN